MKLKRALGRAAVLVALILPGAPALTDPGLIFEQVRLIDPASGAVSAPVDVVVRHGAIQEPHSAPEDALRVPAEGHYLMPGLAEMHAHVPPMRTGQQLEDVLVLYLAHGITTIRGMLGEAGHLVVRQRLASGELIGPRLITSGPSFNARSVASPEAAADMARAQAEAGYDLLKLHPGLWPEAFRAISEAGEALGMDYSGHVSVAVGLDRVLDSRQGSIDHLDGYGQKLVPEDHPLHGTDPGLFAVNLVAGMDADRIPDLARRTAAAGIANVPTQSLLENWATGDIDALMARPAMRWISESTRRQWLESFERIRSQIPEGSGERFISIRRELIRALQEAGSVILLGADAPQILNVPGDAIHHELEIYVAAGLSPAEALASGTTAVARYLGQADRHGCLAPGCVADLILLRANPLDNIRNSREIEGVMRAGRWFDRATLDGLLHAIEQRAAATP